MKNNLKTTTAASLMAVALSTAAYAADYTKEHVTFTSGGSQLVGTLYKPAEAKRGDKLPAVVITGAWMTVKEQMATTYAKELTEQGYAALVFDFRGWGESGTRNPADAKFMESPTMKTADIVAASAYLASRADVDTRRISGLGICASAGYMADALLASTHLSSAALVAPWLHNPQIVNEVYGGSEGVAKLVATSRDAARAQANGKPMLVAAAAPGVSGSTAIMNFAGYYTDPSRGAVPTFDNQFNLASWEDWLTYNAHASAPQQTKPLLIVHSEAAAIPQGAKGYVAAMKGPKAQVWLKDVTQFDFYDQPAAVKRAAEEVVKHFTESATPTAGSPESAKVAGVVASIPLAVDLADYALAEKAFAPRIVIDYTSLWGGEPQTITPAELMTAWRGIVPGFDATQHELFNIQTSVKGNKATATAEVDGRHWLNGKLWRPIGTYAWELEKQRGTWKVTRMTFNMEREIGDRELAKQAMTRAKQMAR